MSKNKSEYKDELDCEITVFEGAHSTCDQTEGDSTEKQTVEGSTASKRERNKR